MNKFIFFIIFLSISFCSFTSNAQNKKRSEIIALNTRKGTLPKPKIGKIGQPVDLGLSIQWASWNVGANDSTDEGGGYYWAEITQRYPKDCNRLNFHKYKDPESGKYLKYYYYQSFDQNYNQIIDTDKDNHAIGTCSPSNDPQKRNEAWGLVYNDCNDTEVMRLDKEDDVAIVEWGDNWRTPTSEEVKELLVLCQWTLIGTPPNLYTVPKEYYGVWGWKVTGPNGNSIFLPGCIKNDYGSIMTSDCSFDGGCYGIRFDGKYKRYNHDWDRNNIWFVRPVYIGPLKEE